jgi:hypothetical protein
MVDNDNSASTSEFNWMDANREHPSAGWPNLFGASILFSAATPD